MPEPYVPVWSREARAAREYVGYPSLANDVVCPPPDPLAEARYALKMAVGEAKNARYLYVRAITDLRYASSRSGFNTRASKEKMAAGRSVAMTNLNKARGAANRAEKAERAAAALVASLSH